MAVRTLSHGYINHDSSHALRNNLLADQVRELRCGGETWLVGPTVTHPSVAPSLIVAEQIVPQSRGKSTTYETKTAYYIPIPGRRHGLSPASTDDALVRFNLTKFAPSPIRFAVEQLLSPPAR